MATPSEIRPMARLAWYTRSPRLSKALRSAGLVTVLLICSLPARAQFQQPFVFSTAGAVMTRNDQTGVLTPVQGSPYAGADFQTLDAQGWFLFGLGTNSIHMYQVNATPGAFSEVATSPFASANTNQPMFIAVEPTGKYIAVVNRAGQNLGESSVETFQIDAANLALVPVPGSFLELDSSVIGAGADLKNRHFYAFLGPNLSSPNQQLHTNSELNDYVLDSQTGLVNLSRSGQPGSVGRCFAMDAQGRFLVIGQGQIEGQVGIFPIAADSGAMGTEAITSLAASVFPIALFVEVTGNFLYLTDTNAPSPPVHIFAIDPQTKALTETSSSPLPGASFVPGFMEDPTGPFMYGSDPTGTTVQAYMTDPLTGYFTPVAGTANSSPGVNGSFVFSIPPGQQNLAGQWRRGSQLCYPWEILPSVHQAQRK
jgi:6-phosphogluconolactonase (cycloisomerase 2 family)